MVIRFSRTTANKVGKLSGGQYANNPIWPPPEEMLHFCSNSLLYCILSSIFLEDLENYTFIQTVVQNCSWTIMFTDGLSSLDAIPPRTSPAYFSTPSAPCSLQPWSASNHYTKHKKSKTPVNGAGNGIAKQKSGWHTGQILQMSAMHAHSFSTVAMWLPQAGLRFCTLFKCDAGCIDNASETWSFYFLNDYTSCN